MEKKHGRSTEEGVRSVAHRYVHGLGQRSRAVQAQSLSGLVASRPLKFLVEQRGVTAIGHESLDTDTTEKDGIETYILHKGRYQIEVMANLDQVPATGALIVVAWPKVRDGLGFPARAFAIPAVMLPRGQAATFFFPWFPPGAANAARATSPCRAPAPPL